VSICVRSRSEGRHIVGQVEKLSFQSESISEYLQVCNHRRYLSSRVFEAVSTRRGRRIPISLGQKAIMGTRVQLKMFRVPRPAAGLNSPRFDNQMRDREKEAEAGPENDL